MENSVGGSSFCFELGGGQRARVFELNLCETKNEKLEAYSQPTFTLRELYFEG